MSASSVEFQVFVERNRVDCAHLFDAQSARYRSVRREHVQSLLGNETPMRFLEDPEPSRPASLVQYSCLVAPMDSTDLQDYETAQGQPHATIIPVL